MRHDPHSKHWEPNVNDNGANFERPKRKPGGPRKPGSKRPLPMRPPGRPRDPARMRLDSVRAMKLRAQRTRYYLARIKRLLPWIEPADYPIARAWIELELLCAACAEQLFEYGVKSPGGKPDPMLGELRSLRRVQLSYAVALGLGPAARQMLQSSGKPWSVDISEEQAQRAIAMSEREPATAAMGDDPKNDAATSEVVKREVVE